MTWSFLEVTHIIFMKKKNENISICYFFKSMFKHFHVCLLDISALIAKNDTFALKRQIKYNYIFFSKYLLCHILLVITEQFGRFITLVLCQKMCNIFTFDKFLHFCILPQDTRDETVFMVSNNLILKYCKDSTRLYFLKNVCTKWTALMTLLHCAPWLPL